MRVSAASICARALERGPTSCTSGGMAPAAAIVTALSELKASTNSAPAATQAHFEAPPMRGACPPRSQWAEQSGTAVGHTPNGLPDDPALLHLRSRTPQADQRWPNLKLPLPGYRVGVNCSDFLVIFVFFWKLWKYRQIGVVTGRPPGTSFAPQRGRCSKLPYPAIP
jgi:hypothetical protein